ncbi:MAG TPA: cytochrome c oxidase assembly protein [Blastocatellia bacterium]|nr:cytochrome c oxidase assembly protein [Blastocatellia bacterium]
MKLRRSAAISLLILAAMTTAVSAHEGEPPAPHDLWTAWSFEPLVIVSLLVSAWLYVSGVRRVWQQAQPGRGVRWWEAAAFAGGWLALFVALVSPVDALGSALFSAHMLQHEILMVVAAPLLVLSRPLTAWLWALPLEWRRRAGRLGSHAQVQQVWRGMTNLLAAWLIHAVVLWGWHLPLLFQATLESEAVHAAQHLSFFVSALLFYQALLVRRNGQMNAGAGVLYVFTTAVHTSVLGALLTFSNALWYPAYRETTAAWGLSPLEDQQLGGLIMWVPAGVVYIIGGLALFGLWLRESERSLRRRENAVIFDAGD